MMVVTMQVKSGGTVQYCKIVCDKGEWRGPYCGQTRERLGGDHHQHHHPNPHNKDIFDNREERQKMEKKSFLKQREYSGMVVTSKPQCLVYN